MATRSRPAAVQEQPSWQSETEKMVHYATRQAANRKRTGNGKRLQTLILNALRRGQDQALGAALSRSSGPAQALLRQEIETIASCRLVVSPKGRLLHGRLMLIPVHMTLNGELCPEVPRTLEAVGLLEAAFRSHQMGTKGIANLPLVLPWLYSLDELASLPWSKTYQLIDRFTELAYDGQPARFAIRGEEPATVSVPTGEFTSYQRFLVGFCAHDAHQVFPFDRDQHTDRAIAWLREVADVIVEQMPGKTWLLPPQPFYTVLEQAAVLSRLDQARMLEMRQAITNGLAAEAVAAQRVIPYFSFHSWHDDNGYHEQVRVAGFHDNRHDEQVFTYVWDLAPFETALEAIDRVETVLLSLPFPDIMCVQGDLDAELCDCCGEPTFRGPVEEDLDDIAPPLQFLPPPFLH